MRKINLGEDLLAGPGITTIARRDFRNHTTFSVGVIKDEHGNLKMVATMNDGRPSKAARAHMEKHGIEDRTDKPPKLKREIVKDSKGKPVVKDGMPVRQTVDKETGKEFDKKKRSDHHAEQRMENSKEKNETVVAQSPSQPCCAGCQKALGTPGKDGKRPIDKIPPDRRQKALRK